MRKQTEFLKKIEAGNYTIEYAQTGQVIAENIRYQGRNVLVDGLDTDDIPDEIWDQMHMSDMVGQGESANCPDHDARRREALIDWLGGCGYILDRDDERGFANEYTMILREASEGDESTLTAEEWADQYLYAGDSATQAYNGFRVEDAQCNANEED
jgi:hypothetical protein